LHLDPDLLVIGIERYAKRRVGSCNIRLRHAHFHDSLNL
jgi:hypothetical protein